MEEFGIDEDEELSLLETLDHVLDRGLVISGEITIAVADVDLIYLGLNLLLGSVESVNRTLGSREDRAGLKSAGGEGEDA
jgi:gas vesicle structural protein